MGLGVYEGLGRAGLGAWWLRVSWASPHPRIAERIAEQELARWTVASWSSRLRMAQWPRHLGRDFRG